MHFAGVSGDLVHWSVGRLPAHLMHRKLWLLYFCVWPYLWLLLHCTISFSTKGGSILTIEFIRRLMQISLMFYFCFLSIKNKDSGFFVILRRMLPMLVTSWPCFKSSKFSLSRSTEWRMLRSTTRNGLSCSSW